MRLVALLSDFGTKDTYVAEMKAAIYSRCENVYVIDITHEIDPQNIKQAAFLLSTSYKHFPDETVIVSVVDPGVGTDRNMIAATADKIYFIGPDNGIFSFLNSIPDSEIYKLETSCYWADDVSSTFHGRDIFAPVAAHIVNGVHLDKFGKKINLVKECQGLRPQQINGEILGEIFWIDSFGNAISNIHRDVLLYINKKIYVQTGADINSGLMHAPLLDNFEEAQALEGEKLFSFIGSKNYLEFAIPNAFASKKYKIMLGSKVRIMQI